MVPIDRELTPEEVEEECRRLAAEYPSLRLESIGRSLLGRRLPLLTVGEGEINVLYVGTHHGAERITSLFLLRFAQEMAKLPPPLRLSILPMLNPDGASIAMGLAPSDPYRQARLRMNGGPDFRRWQANARGVDLNHNYNAGFYAYKEIERSMGIASGAPTRYSGLSPESEPETAALTRWIRRHRPHLILSLHSQGEEIYYKGMGEELAGCALVAERMAARSGYRLAETEGTAFFGGLSDWAISVLGIPSFTVECGKGENPLPASGGPKIYSQVREILLTGTEEETYGILQQ